LAHDQPMADSTLSARTLPRGEIGVALYFVINTRAL
jgi:hypothetical protein